MRKVICDNEVISQRNEKAFDVAPVAMFKSRLQPGLTDAMFWTFDHLVHVVGVES